MRKSNNSAEDVDNLFPQLSIPIFKSGKNLGTFYHSTNNMKGEPKSISEPKVLDLGTSDPGANAPNSQEPVRENGGTVETLNSFFEFLKSISENNSCDSNEKDRSEDSFNEHSTDASLKKRPPRKPDGQSKMTKKIKENNSAAQLEEVIIRLLKNQQIEADDLSSLSDKDFFIFSCLVKRKFKVQKADEEEYCENTNSKRFSLISILRECKARKLSKRVEENRKLVISMVVKHLKDRCSDKLDKMKEKHRKFCDKYFVGIFEAHSITEDLLFQKNRRVNKKYISMLMKSPMFEQDFCIFLQEGFLEKYGEMRRNKVQKIIEKCSEFFEHPKNGFVLIQEYLEENGKCKLPWSDEEVSNAINYFMEWYYGKIKPRTEIMRSNGAPGKY